MILEGIVTTIAPDGKVNISPMGPRVDPELRRLTLRPFRSSRTYRNLETHGEGVFHVTDDVELLARAAVGDVEAPIKPARAVRGHILLGACRAYEFRVTSIDDREDRTTIEAEVLRAEHLREFFGFNRAKHAVVEAAILATRIHILPILEITGKIRELSVLVEKTGGDAERSAFAFLEKYIETSISGTGSPARNGEQAVRVVTGSRLHFGLIAPGRGGPRRFGGAGLMVERPAVDLRVEAAARGTSGIDADGPLAGRAAEAASLCARTRAYRIRVAAAPPEHAGFGAGTQIGLAVARAITTLEGRDLSLADLAASVGRGRRSAIGVHGFAEGGFLVDGGKREESSSLAPLVLRKSVPRDWRVVIATPHGGTGTSGAREEETFRSLASVPPALSEAMSHALVLGIVPALVEADFAAFGEALHEYGVKAGESFRGAQGGVFASSGAAALIQLARSEGFAGAGQSSWGPAVYAFAEDEDRSAFLARRIAERFGPEQVDVTVTAARDRGAAVEAP